MVTVNKNYLKLPGSYLFSTYREEGKSIQGGQSGIQRFRDQPWNRRCDTAACTGDHRCPS